MLSSFFSLISSLISVSYLWTLSSFFHSWFLNLFLISTLFLFLVFLLFISLFYFFHFISSLLSFAFLLSVCYYLEIKRFSVVKGWDHVSCESIMSSSPKELQTDSYWGVTKFLSSNLDQPLTTRIYSRWNGSCSPMIG